MNPPQSQKIARRRLIVQRALRGYELLPAAEKIELLIGAADFLPKAEAEAARSAAFCLQEAEAQQLKFNHLLSQP